MSDGSNVAEVAEISLRDTSCGSSPRHTTEQREATRREREMAQLRDLLSYPRWSPEQAVNILAGIDPELTMGGPGDYGFAWLPEGQRTSWMNADGTIDRFELEEHVSMELEDVRGFVFGEARSPAEWVAHSRAHNYTPPWLEVAEKEGLLKTDLHESDPYSGQREGGLSTQRATSQHEAKCEILRAWDERSRDFSGKDVRDFKNEMKQVHAYCNPPKVSDRTVVKWIGDLNRERETGIPCEWAVEIRSNEFSSAS